MKTRIVALIEEYLKVADKCRNALSQQFGTPDILRAVNSSEIPREGNFNAFGGGRYSVHGAGCRIEAENMEIDFDFGPSNSINAFDPWKLYDYADNHRDVYDWIPERKEFEQVILNLISEGRLKRTGTYPNPDLLSPTA